MPSPGDIGPLMAALMQHLAKVKDVCTPEKCELPTCSEIAEEIDFPRRNVQRAIERLRARKSLLASYVKDGRLHNGGRRHRRPVVEQTGPVETLSLTEAALRSRSALEQVWRNSGVGELGA